MIPISYNVRSLGARKATTAATALGVGAVVFVFSSVLMLANGIENTLSQSGAEDVAIVMRAGSDAELSSGFDATDVGLVTAPPQVRRRDDGTPDGTGELVAVLAMDKVGGDGFSNVQVRGVGDDVWDFRSTARIVEGRAPQPGAAEVAVGSAIRGRFVNVDLGQTFELGDNRPVTVVGIFEDGGSSYESEVWAGIESARVAFGRMGLVSAVRVRLRTAGDLDAYREEIEGNRRLGLSVTGERAYYEKQSEGTATFMKAMGLIIAVLFSLGAMIGAMITMYSAVASRSREIGALRALGFSKASILGSFLLESLLLSVLGGAIGAAASLAMSLVRFSVVNFASWSEIVFRFDPTPDILASSLIFAAVMGLVGGLFPAARAARMGVLDALRAR